MDGWSRKEITCCNCAALSYIHVHCPWCKGKAVSRSVEHRHWQQSQLLQASSLDDALLNPSPNDVTTEENPIGEPRIYVMIQ